ncbi:IS66 family insertion sequence element accessory protein TnpB [Priestia megaterium]
MRSKVTSRCSKDASISMLRPSMIESVYLERGSTNMRKSIDGLAILVQVEFNLDPFSSSLFVFCCNKGSVMKMPITTIRKFQYKKPDFSSIKLRNLAFLSLHKSLLLLENMYITSG